MSIPFIPEAISKLEYAPKDLRHDWNIFVGIIVALSGVEAIANTTGSMKLNRGSSYENPLVFKTSTPAILMVMLEVSIFTALFGLVMNALPGLEVSGEEVSAPGYPNVRDAMLRYMAEIFGGSQFGQTFGYYFGIITGVVFALLLLSAVNTATIALISLFFVMSRDEELPKFFQTLNRFGVPHYATIVALTLPAIILLIINDIASLANLYAIGFVGAIAINLFATSTNFKLPMKTWERALMFFTSLIMILIEITLFIDKPHARGFVIAVIGIGLLLRAIVLEQKEKITELPPVVSDNRIIPPELSENESNAMLVAVTGINKSLDFALEEAQTSERPLFILFIREQKIITEKDYNRLWLDDKGACDVVDYVIDKSIKTPLGFLYTVTPHTTHSIIEIAKQKNVCSVILGRNRGDTYSLLSTLRGTTIRDVSKRLPKDVNLIVVY